MQAKNDLPTMNPVADQTTSEATAKTIEFLVDDKDGPLTFVEGNLNYTVVTEPGDTSGLVAATGAVVWGGTWPLCTGTLTPEALKSGQPTYDSQSTTAVCSPAPAAPSK